MLDALLDEVHVSEAGKKLDLSQAATSHALKQLRLLFHDPLLIRGQSGQMALSPRALSLKQPVKQAIQQLSQVFNVEEVFSPMAAEHTFHIGMSDYVAFVILPHLINALKESAPKIKLKIHHCNYINDAALLTNGSLDLVIGGVTNPPQQLKSQLLFTDTGTFVVDKKHPLNQKKIIRFNDLLNYPFIMASYVENPNGNFLDRLFKQCGVETRVKITVPHAAIALQSLKHNDYITHTVKRIATPMVKQIGLTLIPTPKDAPDTFHKGHYQVKQYWHASKQEDPAHRWLRSFIKSIGESHE